MKKTLIAVAIIVALLAAAYGMRKEEPEKPPPVADLASTRTIADGTVVGFAEEHNTHSWLGIPFAQPPVGDLRWKPPQSPEPWQGTLEALDYSEWCSQIGVGIGGIPLGEFGGSEDCLYLNVFSPRFSIDSVPSGDEALPVMVWIHGGANQLLSAEATPYAYKLAGDHKLIVVTISYRLGLLGWFYHPALYGPDASELERSGNYGTLDIIQSLRWVQENIAAFGGDPNRVTIFGESAGAYNVFAMIASPLAKGLFHGAISQSGGMVGQWNKESAHHLTDSETPGHENSSSEVFLELLTRAGKAADRDEAKAVLANMTDDQIGDFLRSLSAEELTSYYGARRIGGPLRITPNNIADGTVIPEMDTAERLSNPNNHNAVPLITGTNRDELKFFLSRNQNLVDTYLGFIPIIKDTYDYNRTSDYFDDLWQARAVTTPATLRTNSSAAPVYAYRFDWDEQGTRLGIIDLSALFGAAHAMEIPFVFNAHEKENSLYPSLYSEDNLDGVKELSNAMSSYWAEFAYTGSPGRGRDGTLPEWKAWSNDETDKIIILDTSNDKGIRMEQDAYTINDIYERLAKDPLPTQEERCAGYRSLFTTGMTFEGADEEFYRNLGEEGCPAE